MKLGYVSLPGRGATDLLLAGAVARLEARGIALVGTVQTNIERPDRHHCDMDLRLMPAGPAVRISLDRGAGATGCRLDAGVLEQAVLWVSQHLDGAQMLVVNKFGKQEAEGRAFAPVIGEALARGLPVLVGVNGLNLGPFLTFADGLAEPLPGDAAAVADWCLAACAAVAEG
ncbi:DUF2478 domain-containing protein [Ruixingdingia sedimenti]|uniref:DUF2478 domain-containing protein n=1 Tax=Ruixingdingia sedimenti TaxID=3073604 RepID=A0ABU1F9Q7_9RHOB|nr:DUF2478 domain-containing protein [Xinfangfangia sp. LG-4]MDR5653154.1 DUF2478 domain-containing protein [Xinfangfangia sp. LG-4]